MNNKMSKKDSKFNMGVYPNGKDGFMNFVLEKDGKIADCWKYPSKTERDKFYKKLVKISNKYNDGSSVHKGKIDAEGNARIELNNGDIKIINVTIPE